MKLEKEMICSWCGMDIIAASIPLRVRNARMLFYCCDSHKRRDSRVYWFRISLFVVLICVSIALSLYAGSEAQEILPMECGAFLPNPRR